MNSFNGAAAGPKPVTTARELANEMGTFIASLTQSADKLREEIANIKTAKKEIAAEREHVAAEFVKTTVTELFGEQFDAMDTLATGVAELGGQSLGFYRNRLVSERDAALQAANEVLDVTVDAAGFQAALSKAETDLEAAAGEAGEAKAALKAAEGAKKEWTDNTVEDDLVALNKEIISKGGPALTSDNRAYYEPKGIVAKIVNYFTRGSAYRQVRSALNTYGHGTDGKDAFADLAAFTDKETAFDAAIAAAQTAFDAAGEKKATAAAAVSKLEGVAGKIKTDDQILEAVQAKIVENLETPEFVKAIAEHYAEDFPRKLPLLMAKTSALSKLEQGAEDKLDAATKNIIAATKQYNTLSKVKPFTKVNADLDSVRKRNTATAGKYRRYSESAGNWKRARDYDYDYGRNTTVYVDNSPSMLEMYIMYELLNDHHHHDHYNPADHGTFVPGADSAYTADMLGLNKDQADELGMPPAVFELPEDAVAEIQDAGGDTFSLDDNEEGLEQTFELDGPEQGLSETFDLGSDNSAQPSTFSLDDQNDSPSFSSGPSHS